MNERFRPTAGVLGFSALVSAALALLQKYWEERFGEKLTEISARSYGGIVLRVLRSEPVNRSD